MKTNPNFRFVKWLTDKIENLYYWVTFTKLYLRFCTKDTSFSRYFSWFGATFWLRTRKKGNELAWAYVRLGSKKFAMSLTLYGPYSMGVKCRLGPYFVWALFRLRPNCQDSKNNKTYSAINRPTTLPVRKHWMVRKARGHWQKNTIPVWGNTLKLPS